MDTNELKDKVNKRINEGMESVFDIFENIFGGFQSNFDKIFGTETPSVNKQETTDDKKGKTINTTEIHSFKEFKDGKCVNSGKKVWENGKLVCDEGTTSSIEDKSECKCDCTKETGNCECKTENKNTSSDFLNEQLRLKVEAGQKRISELEAQIKTLTVENTELKGQLNAIKNVIKK